MSLRKPPVSKCQLLPALSELDPFVNSTGIAIQTVQVTTDIPLCGPLQVQEGKAYTEG